MRGGGPTRPTYQYETAEGASLYGTPTGKAGGGAAHAAVSPGVVLDSIIKS